MEWPLALILAVFTASACAQITLDDCPPGVRRDRLLRAWGSSCYHFTIDHAREFPTAESECEASHGHLAIVRDAATNEFLYNTLKNELHYTGVVFIGLTDEETENVWKWVDGTTATYTNWAQGQPGFLGTFEDCAVMDTREGGKWADYRCEDLLFVSGDHKFICEYPVTTSGTGVTSPDVATSEAGPVQTNGDSLTTEETTAAAGSE